ncbi:MAG: hypothetical protein KF723_14190 [Rhizobiaceae bacterium]|nr:hypothetical protein [Rhizobiaceae bacterium]
MTDLVRFLACNAAIGFGLAAGFVGLVVGIDVGGLRSLAAASAAGPYAIGLLFVATGLTFASVQMGFAVMLLAHAPGPGGGKAKRSPVVAMRRLAVLRIGTPSR